MMEAISSSETSVLTTATRRHIPQDGILRNMYSILLGVLIFTMLRLMSFHRQRLLGSPTFQLSHYFRCHSKWHLPPVSKPPKTSTASLYSWKAALKRAVRAFTGIWQDVPFNSVVFSLRQAKTSHGTAWTLNQFWSWHSQRLITELTWC
jgi:hypothetical protein